MTPYSLINTAPVSPALVAGVFHRLAQLPISDRIDTSQLVTIMRTVTASERTGSALLIRIRAAALVMNDPRWPAWSRHVDTSAHDDCVHGHRLVMQLIASQPLTATLEFSSDAFFAELFGHTSLAPGKSDAGNSDMAARVSP